MCNDTIVEIKRKIPKDWKDDSEVAEYVFNKGTYKYSARCMNTNK